MKKGLEMRTLRFPTPYKAELVQLLLDVLIDPKRINETVKNDITTLTFYPKSFEYLLIQISFSEWGRSHPDLTEKRPPLIQIENEKLG